MFTYNNDQLVSFSSVKECELLNFDQIYEKYKNSLVVENVEMLVSHGDFLSPNDNAYLQLDSSYIFHNIVVRFGRQYDELYSMRDLANIGKQLSIILIPRLRVQSVKSELCCVFECTYKNNRCPRTKKLLDWTTLDKKLTNARVKLDGFRCHSRCYSKLNNRLR